MIEWYHLKAAFLAKGTGFPVLSSVLHLEPINGKERSWETGTFCKLDVPLQLLLSKKTVDSERERDILLKRHHLDPPRCEGSSQFFLHSP